MSKNVGSADKIIRLVAGATLIGAATLSGMSLFASSTATIIGVVVGAVLIGTALTNFCPLYRLLGLRTCKG